MAKKKQKRQVPTTHEDWGRAYEELASENERACAIVGAAMLDEALRQRLTNFLLEDEPIVEDLFEQGPLHDLFARTEMAYCLGLISKVHRDDLHAIRKVRNIFAHRLHNASFADPEVVGWCNRLQMGRIRIRKPPDAPARELFQATVARLMHFFSFTKMQVSAQRRKPYEPPRSGGEDEERGIYVAPGDFV